MQETREEIDIEEVRTVWRAGKQQIWLRYRPRPGDTSQCWVRRDGANGSWRIAPPKDSGDLQMLFVVESALRLLAVSASPPLGPQPFCRRRCCTRLCLSRVQLPARLTIARWSSPTAAARWLARDPYGAAAVRGDVRGRTSARCTLHFL